MKSAWILIVPFFFLLACGEPKGTEPTLEGISSFDVKFKEGTDLGTPEKPLSKKDKYTFTVDIIARNYNGSVNNVPERKVEISLLGGKLSSSRFVNLVDGVARDVEVSFKYGVEKERITVVEKELEKSELSGGRSMTLDTGKIGVSDTIHLPLLTISDIQSNKPSGVAQASNYEKRNVNLVATNDNLMIVVGVLDGGMCVQQLGVDEYAGLFLYTHSSPFVDEKEKGEKEEKRSILRRGAMIAQVNGSIGDFFGFNEMSFPSFEPLMKDDKVVYREDLLPQVKDITSILGNDKELEKYESTMVKVTNAGVPYFPDDDESFLEYGQFPLNVRIPDGEGDFITKKILAVTSSTVPSFDAREYRPASAGEPVKYGFESFTGVLKQHRAAKYGSTGQTWMIVPLGKENIVFTEE